MAGQDIDLKRLIKTYEETPLGKTGVKWYDNWIDKQKTKTMGGMSIINKMAKSLGIFDKVKDWTPLKTFLDVNDEYLRAIQMGKSSSKSSFPCICLRG